MAILGSAVYKLIADAAGLKKGLRDAERATKTAADKGERQTGRMRAAFGKVGASVKNAAGQVPFLGGALTQLATPVGAITLAVGGLAAVLGGSVKKIINVERELRPMIERSRIGAEALQVLAEAAERAGSEDGLEGVVDTSQELQLQLGELALTGAGRAKEALAALGLEAQRLQEMKPEEAWRLVVQEIQKIPNVADRAIAAEEIFGGTSEKLAGIVNMTNAEFQALIASVEGTADILSEDALRSAQEFDQEWRKITGTFGQVRTAIGTAVLPYITQFIDKINQMVADIRTAREQIANGWDVIKKKTVDALNATIDGYNKTIGKLPGVAKLDMIEIAESTDTATDSLEGMAETTEKTAERTSQGFQEISKEAQSSAKEIEQTRQEHVTRVNDIEQAAADERNRIRSEEFRKNHAAMVQAQEEAIKLQKAAAKSILDAELAALEARTEAAKMAHAERLELIEAEAERFAEARQREMDLEDARTQHQITKIKEVAAQRQQAHDEAQKQREEEQKAFEELFRSYETWQERDNETLTIIRRNGVDFGDVLDRMAKESGVSRASMIQDLTALGIKYGDFAALIAHYGETVIGGFAASLIAMKNAANDTAATLAGMQSGGGGTGVGDATRVEAAGSAVVESYEGPISALIQQIMRNNERAETLPPFSPEWRAIQEENRRIQAEIDALKRQRDEERRAAERRAGRGAGPSGPVTMDRGGIVTGPTIAALAMNGRPEAVIPLDRAGGGFGGPQIVFQGPVYGLDEFNDRVRDAIDIFTRRGGTF